MSDTEAAIDQRCIDTIRTFSMGAVQAAGARQHGNPIARAPVSHELRLRSRRFENLEQPRRRCAREAAR